MNLRKHVFLAMALAVLLFPCSVFAAQAQKQAAAPQPEAVQANTAALNEFQPDDSFRKDRHLLDRLQYDAFRYIWDHTFPESGLAYEDSRNKETGQATIGGSASAWRPLSWLRNAAGSPIRTRWIACSK